MFSFDERVQVDQEKIEKEFVLEFLCLYEKLFEERGLYLSFFDFITLCAFKYWEEKAIDIAVVEVGLGGKIDSTNVIASPLMSVITSIGLDHQRLLGNRIEQITGNFVFFNLIVEHKCGIIKPGRPVLIGNTVPYQQAKDIADGLGSELTVLDAGFDNYEEENKEMVRLIARKVKEVSRFDFESKIDEAFDTETLPCRYEKVPERLLGASKIKDVILDMGHNHQSLQRVMERLKNDFKLKKIGVVFSGNKAKDVQSMIELLSNEADYLYLTFPSSQQQQYSSY